MSLANIGNFVGVVVPNKNMVEVFRENELKSNKYSALSFRPMTLKKFTISCEPGTIIKINGKNIELPTGIFELSMGQHEISSLVFSSAVDVSIFYAY